MADRFWTKTRLLNKEALNNWANDKDIALSQLEFTRKRACRLCMLMQTGLGALARRFPLNDLNTRQCRHTIEENKKLLRGIISVKMRMCIAKFKE
ncbi:hypothetical protein YC2023_061684 [Brassica napus]